MSLEPTSIEKLREQLSQQPATMSTDTRYTDSFEILGGAGDKRGGYYSADGGSLQKTLEQLKKRWHRNHSDKAFVVDGLRVPKDQSQLVRTALSSRITTATSVSKSKPVVGGTDGAQIMDKPTQKDVRTETEPTPKVGGDPNPGVHWDVPDAGVLNSWVDKNNYAIIHHGIDGLGNLNKAYGPWDTINPAGGFAYEHDLKLRGGPNACQNNAWWAMRSDTTWSSSLPGAYLDTGASDVCSEEDFTVGSYHAFALDSRKHYTITMGTRRGIMATSNAKLTGQTLKIHNYPQQCGRINPWCVGLPGSRQNISYIADPDIGFTMPGCYIWAYSEGARPCPA